VEFADFNHGPKETPMTNTNMPLIELLQKHDEGFFLRAVTEAVLRDQRSQRARRQHARLLRRRRTGAHDCQTVP
jgi:hypothetical protein